MDNYLAAAQLIIDRLKDQVDALATVSDWSEYATLDEATFNSPAAYVLFLGYRPTQEHSDGSVQQTEQLWGVVVAVRNARQARAKSGVREDAGPLMASVMAALQGWRPSKEHSALKLTSVDAARPTYGATVGFFPMIFASKVVIEGID